MASTKQRKTLPGYDKPLKNKLDVLTFNDEMKINYTTGKKTDFKAPTALQTVDYLIKHPTTDVQTITTAASVAIVHVAKKTIAKIAIAQAMTITVDSTSESEAGDELILLLTADGSARTATFSTGLSAGGGTLAATASKTSAITFVHNGTTFVEVSRSVAA